MGHDHIGCLGHGEEVDVGYGGRHVRVSSRSMKKPPRWAAPCEHSSAHRIIATSRHSSTSRARFLGVSGVSLTSSPERRLRQSASGLTEPPLILLGVAGALAFVLIFAVSLTAILAVLTFALALRILFHVANVHRLSLDGRVHSRDRRATVAASAAAG
jgi:hypothetical protein